jgi:translocator protein
MFSFLNRPDRLGLISNIGFFALLALVSNIVTNAFDWNSSGDAVELRPDWAPPGWAIGVVWLGLLALLGAARWLTLRHKGAYRVSSSRWVPGLSVFCCLYPFWTLAFDSRLMGLIGNVLTLFLAGWVTVKVHSVSGWVTAIVAVVVVWVIFATILLMRLIQLNSWS